MDAEQQSSAENYKKNRFFRLKVIVPVLMVGVTFASCVAVGIGGYLNARSGLKEAAQGELTMVARARQALVGMPAGRAFRLAVERLLGCRCRARAQ